MILADVTTTLGITAAVVAILTFAAAILAGIFFSSKSKGTKEALESLGITNQRMDEALKFERGERIRDQKECDRQIAHLTGQIDVMQKQQISSLTERMNDAATEAMTHMVSATLDRLETGLHAAVSHAVAAGVEAGIKAANHG